MKIFPNDSELEAQYAAGKAPAPEALLAAGGNPAKRRVTMLTGPIPNFGGWPFHHYKEFAMHGAGVGGCNIFTLSGLSKLLLIPILYMLDFDGIWGAFDAKPADGHLLLDYGVAGNGWLSRPIVDHLRATDDPRVFLGKFHYRFFGKLVFLGFFRLTLIED